MPDYKRGEIYYVAPNYSETGSEIWSGRPAVIVSNDDLNRNRNCVEVVYLTTPEAGLSQPCGSPCHGEAVHRPVRADFHGG